MMMCYETERLYLKLLLEDSASGVLKFYLDNKELFEQFEPDRPDNFYTLAYQESLLTCEFNFAVKKSSLRFWVFKKKEPDRIIGTISFHNMLWSVYRSCQIGYKFDQTHWHCGYAGESIRMALAILFQELELHRVEALVLPSNVPSIHLLETLGFSEEGTCRSCINLHGSWTDHLRYSIILP